MPEYRCSAADMPPASTGGRARHRTLRVLYLKQPQVLAGQVWNQGWVFGRLRSDSARRRAPADSVAVTAVFWLVRESRLMQGPGRHLLTAFR